MSIIWKFPKSIASRAERPSGPRVWDPCTKTQKRPVEGRVSSVTLCSVLHSCLSVWELRHAATFVVNAVLLAREPFARTHPPAPNTGLSKTQVQFFKFAV